MLGCLFILYAFLDCYVTEIQRNLYFLYNEFLFRIRQNVNLFYRLNVLAVEVILLL